MDKIKAIVIDDEFFNRGLITMLILRLNSNFIVSGEAESVNEGYKLITETQPDVVFLDIKMPDGSGFDLLKRFVTINFSIVFITGFDQYTMEAFEHNALDYVLKPVDLDKFRQTLEHVQTRVQKNRSSAVQLKSAGQSFAANTADLYKIPIQQKDAVILVSLNEIQYVLAKEKITLFSKNKDEIFTSSTPLSDFEITLSHVRNFVKLNEATYINLDFVMSYTEEGGLRLTMSDGAVMDVLPARKSELLKLLSAKQVSSRE